MAVNNSSYRKCNLQLTNPSKEKYDPAYVQYNLNTNETAVEPLDYWGEWVGHDFTPSPDNWRFPFYTLFLDRFVNGDPTNDNINGTAYEHDITSSQMRHGGDLLGLIDTLDYLHGMGIKGIYIAGSPFLNQPWGYDSYSPVDLSVLDWHFGTIDTWRQAVTEIHARGMYVILDSTFATLGDLIGFEGHLNTTTPFMVTEHKVQWKTRLQYWDFQYGNTYNETCDYPRFYNETGYRVDQYVTDSLVGCYDSEFDQYGDTEAFGVFPDWRRQLSKFSSVQDRLREWHEPVRLKLENFYCMVIAQLDIDGYRYDKATQATVDAMGMANEALRRCARRYNKRNFFLSGEITGGNDFGAVYIGRGRQPDQKPENLTVAVTMTNTSDDKYFIRPSDMAALDSAAFHYTTYRTLTRFLGMDGNLEAGYDAPKNWVNQWNSFLLTNDFVNQNTGVFDPRHMFGVTNQDVFRWGAIRQGVERQLLGHFITTIHLPGVPLLLWGEEQAFYILDNTASNYIFGRQPISASSAWQMHGCYHLGSTQYFNMPLEAARTGCGDDTVSYDHRDPSHPIRNIIRRMHQLRDAFPVLNDGFFLQQLSNLTYEVVYPGSSGVETETGLWSVMRSEFAGVQDLSGNGWSAPIWLVYSNLNETKTYEFDCANNDTYLNITALVAPYDEGTVVKNLFYPYDEHTLESSTRTLGINGSTRPNGCLSNLDMSAYGFKAFVPIDLWVGVKPMITKFSPGHDARILATGSVNETQSINVEIEFSTDMDCDSVTNSIQFNSTTEGTTLPSIDRSTVQCGTAENATIPPYVGAIASKWSWTATILDVAHGIHALTVRNASAADGTPTNANDRFLFRVGTTNNPIVFPQIANYSSTLLVKSEGDQLTLNHSAAGADSWRYSTNFRSSFSDWMPYSGGQSVVKKQNWTGTSKQKWSGDHVRVEYFSRLSGSSAYVQEADSPQHTARRFPHLFLNGPYNGYGYDGGLSNEMELKDDFTWSKHWMVEWSNSGALAQLNVWGMNPDGKPDQSFVLGDADGDSILDRLPPSSLTSVVLNVTRAPPKPYLAWRVVVNDSNLRFRLVPSGSMWTQLILFILLWTVPVITAAISVYVYMKGFYSVKFNQIGISDKVSLVPLIFKRPFQRLASHEPDEETGAGSKGEASQMFLQQNDEITAAQGGRRRTVLIATMEYDIEDWAIKVKIGGLGVMAQLMGKNLGHQDLIWVVPCVGGIDYPTDQPAEPIIVTILGAEYEINVQIHKLRNITYVLLDAPVFRQQSKAEPYPPRMDDLDSAIYYSAWNQSIAACINRFPIDLYHINDYHGSVAPLYLLPRSIPACLSLHNAEFQGLWPMRTKQEREEVCKVFNLSQEVVSQYVQFGEVFNLLHAGASYLRVHQEGFGAVGVSKKYGKRSWARYPIFWGLKKCGALPNPDPSDTGEWDKKLPRPEDIHVDPEYEASRGELRRQAQEWAGLEQNPNAELFVFVGRWSMQKGIDLIADVFPSILDAHKDVQLITVGPVIDLYGKFAALKLDKMMKLYPGRVFSKPEFTALPPYIFSGAEFALIPSRDEPFGLVAVEFGRKGALGVGARVGGLGQMPGWWFTIESTTTSHMLHQFHQAIDEALASSTETRALMRARSAKQRFPVAQWVEDLEILQGTAIRIHDKVEASRRHTAVTDYPSSLGAYNRTSFFGTSGANTPTGSRTPRAGSRNSTYASLQSLGIRLRNLSYSRNLSAEGAEQRFSGLSRQVSLGSRHGPGHVRGGEQTDGVQPQSNLSSIPDEHSSSPRDENAGDDEYEEQSTSDLSDDEDLTMPSRARTGRNTVGTSDNTRLELPPSPRLLPPGSPPATAHADNTSGLVAPRPAYAENRLSATPSLLSVSTIVGDKTDFKLQSVDPFFTDSNGEFYRAFEKKLEGLTAANSESANCIEIFLTKSEKKWFDDYRNAKLGRPFSSRSSFAMPAESTRLVSSGGRLQMEDEASSLDDEAEKDVQDQFLLGQDYKPPTGLRKLFQIKVGDWPVYAFFMGLGQIIAANSYQITLLTGEVGQAASKLYTIASIYLVTSVCWWILYRRAPSVYSLSLPWFFYGLAFVLIGCAHFASSASSVGWMQNMGTAFYAVASSSGSIFFALNFGDEGGAQVKAWVFRASVIQGTQQLYVAALWYWGSIISKRESAGLEASTIADNWTITAITLPIAVVLWIVGIMMFLGLPNYYRQKPGSMPSFYHSLLRRKIVLWFFVMVIIQNFFLSAPYGRNWSFLWSSSHTKTWQIVLMIFIFFVGVWALFLWLFGYLSKSHSWILPIFAIGLLAPRWAQIWWGTSNIGLYLPWAGSFTTSALLSRALWLWLGLLDSIQGVGFGMILLGTLTRVHVAFTLIAAQVIGSVFTIIARAVAPNKIGPGPISPDISDGVSAIWQAWFWIGLVLNLAIALGFYKFYRKEQLQKP
ncbi:hypothetical protein DV735_g3662, partial [Chaetothyriales sp. CBS 134920]